MELVVPSLVNLIAVIAIITGLVLTVWWIIGLYWMHSRHKEHELPEKELPGHLHEVFTGVPVVLIILMVFTGVTLVSYVIAVWQTGTTF